MNSFESRMARKQKRGKATGPDFYDEKLYEYTQRPEREAKFRKLAEKAAEYTIGNVLDLGCGLGWPADYINEREYVGVDFSPFAVEYAQAHTKNPNATFLRRDITEIDVVHPDLGMSDTVMALEFLEHVEDPVRIAQLMLRLARKRIVVSVPRNMPGTGHVWGIWEREDMESLLGDLSLWEVFPPWYLAIRDVGEEVLEGVK